MKLEQKDEDFVWKLLKVAHAAKNYFDQIKNKDFFDENGETSMWRRELKHALKDLEKR